MRKAVLFLAVGLFTLTACNSNSSEDADEQDAVEEVVGDQKDAHGCLTSAGETWSELQQACVQIFNVGQRLNPVEASEGEAEISAFVLLNDDKSKAEIFLADNEGATTILDKGDGDAYQNDVYKFDSKEAALYINGEKKFEGKSVE